MDLSQAELKRRIRLVKIIGKKYAEDEDSIVKMCKYFDDIDDLTKAARHLINTETFDYDFVKYMDKWSKFLNPSKNFPSCIGDITLYVNESDFHRLRGRPGERKVTHALLRNKTVEHCKIIMLDKGIKNENNKRDKNRNNE